MLFALPAIHVQTRFADDGSHGQRAQAWYASQIHSADAEQLSLAMQFQPNLLARASTMRLRGCAGRTVIIRIGVLRLRMTAPWLM